MKKARPGRPKKLQADDARTEILEGAARCFARLGIEKSSVSQIALASKKSRALVTHYFPVKDDLFTAVIQHILKTGYSQIENPPAPIEDETSVKSIGQIFGANLAFFLNRPDYLQCFTLLYYYSSINPELHRLTDRIADLAVTRFEVLLENRGLAELLHGQLIGSILRFNTIQHGFTIDQYVKHQWVLVRRHLLSPYQDK